MKIIACLALLLAPSIHNTLPPCSTYTTITNCQGTVEVVMQGSIVVYLIDGEAGR